MMRLTDTGTASSARHRIIHRKFSFASIQDQAGGASEGLEDLVHPGPGAAPTGATDPEGDPGGHSG